MRNGPASCGSSSALIWRTITLSNLRLKRRSLCIIDHARVRIDGKYVIEIACHHLKYLPGSTASIEESAATVQAATSAQVVDNWLWVGLSVRGIAGGGSAIEVAR
jgi:hypothetical protein